MQKSAFGLDSDRGVGPSILTQMEIWVLSSQLLEPPVEAMEKIAVKVFQLHALACKHGIVAIQRSGMMEPSSLDRLSRTAHGMTFEQIVAVYAGILFITVMLARRMLQTRPQGRPIVAVKGGWPFIGQVFTMVKGSPWDTMARWSKQYGGVYSFTLFGEQSICVSDPDILKGILHTQMTIFKKDVEWTYKPFLEILGNGLVTSDGESWRRQRILLSNYLRIQVLDQIPETTFAAVERLCVKLDKAVSTGETIEMAEEFRSLTLQVIAEVLVSLDPDEANETFAKMYLPIMEESNMRVWNPTRMFNLLLPAWWKHRADVKSLNDYFTSIINKRWKLRQQERAEQSDSKSKSAEHADDSTSSSSSSSAAAAGEQKGGQRRQQDVLDKVLEAIKQEDWDRNSDICVKQIRDELKTFVLAGHETSASMLAWTLYEMHARPGDTSNIDRILAEAAKVYQGHCNHKGIVTSMPLRSVIAGDNLPADSEYRGLDYTESCLRESLRKYSIVPTVVRSVSADTMVGPYFFSKGLKIMVNMQGAHHNPANWPEPEEYRPSRFSKENFDKIKPYTFLPFIDGPRNCLGQFLSLLESKCVLSMLLKRYSFELMNPKTAGEKHSFMVPIIPAEGHFFKVHAKK